MDSRVQDDGEAESVHLFAAVKGRQATGGLYSLRPTDFQILVCGGVLMGESKGDAPWDNI